MPRLLLLNGPPGIGKSTLARRYAADRPLTLCLDVDVVRAMLGQWERHEREAGMLAREIAVAAARVHLDAGHDVVVPQYLGRVEFVTRLEEVAAEVRATFVEVVLMDERDEAIERAAGIEGVGEMYDRLVAMLASRPRAIVVDTMDSAVDEAYERLLAAIR